MKIWEVKLKVIRYYKADKLVCEEVIALKPQQQEELTELA